MPTETTFPFPWSFADALQAQLDLTFERELAVDTSVRYHFNRTISTWKDALNASFYRHFATIIQPTAGWNPVVARSLGTEDDLLGQLDDALDDMDESVFEDMDAAQEDEERHGFLLGLWALASQGVSITDYLLPAMGVGLIAAYGGVPYKARMAARRAAYQDRMAQVLRANIRIGAGVNDTLAMMNGLGTSFENQLVNMLGDELFAATLTGKERALAPYRDQIVGELWITKQDERVCAICRPLHLTITTKRPIQDTHPKCRCITLPLVDAAAYVPLAFDAFAGRFR